MPPLARQTLIALALLAVAAAGVGGRAEGQVATPAAVGYAGSSQGFAGTATDIDAWWRSVFQQAGLPYHPPRFAQYESPTSTACGTIDPDVHGELYCPLDETIYLTTTGASLRSLDIEGDYAVVTIIAHEWGHHVQHLLGEVPTGDGPDFELQADCLAGAFTAHAKQAGLLEPGDLHEAALLSISAGDPPVPLPGLPNEHGTSDQRLEAFMEGEVDGLARCDVPQLVAPAATAEPVVVTATPTSSSLPRVVSTLPPTPTATPTPTPTPSPTPRAIATATPSPTPVPPTATPTPTPVPPTSTPTPLPTPVPPPVAATYPGTLLPTALSLAGGQAFRVEEDGPTGLPSGNSDLGDPATARGRLLGWGWQGGWGRVFAADTPPAGSAGWVEFQIDAFATADDAAAALEAVDAGRRQRLGLSPLDLGLYADQAAAMAGPAYNGTEVTLLARRANLLLRVTGIAPAGDPTADVSAAALTVLGPLADDPALGSDALWASLPDPASLPFAARQTEQHARSASTIARSFPNPADAERRFVAWDWRESIGQVWEVDAPAGQVTLELSAFRFGSPEAAAAALPYFADVRAAALGLGRTPVPDVRADQTTSIGGPVAGGREVSGYARRGATLFRLTATGPGRPLVPLAMLLKGW